MDIVWTFIAENPLPTLAFGTLLLAAVVVGVRIFGADRIWQGLVSVYDRIIGGGRRLPIAILLLPMALGACSAFPRTTAAFNEGGVGQALDTFLAEAQPRVVATCGFVDRPDVSTIVDLAAGAIDQTEAVADIREDRGKWCDALGGELTVDLQNAPES